jgi:hypothetical protein
VRLGLELAYRYSCCCHSDCFLLRSCCSVLENRWSTQPLSVAVAAAAAVVAAAAAAATAVEVVLALACPAVYALLPQSLLFLGSTGDTMALHPSETHCNDPL